MSAWPSELPDPSEVRGFEPDDGRMWAWVEEDDDWRLADPVNTCGFHNRAHGTCRRPAVAALRRHRTGGAGAWHLYCDEHLYGRRVADGKVWYIRAVPAAASADGGGPR